MTMLLHALKLLGWLGFIGFVVLWFVPLGNERLYQAIDEGDEAQAIHLIKAGVNPNSTLGTYAPQFVDREAVQGHPLHFALAHRLPHVAVALLEAGADPNAASRSDGETPLHYGPNGPGGHYPGFGRVPKSLQPEIREMLIKAGAK